MSWTDEDEIVRLDDCKAVRSTPKALLVSGPELDDDLWVPQSVIDDESEVFAPGDEGELVIKEWWARKAGLV